MAKMKRTVIVASGKRKTAITRATTTSGKGRIRINKVPLEIHAPEVAKAKILEPLRLAKDAWQNVDINVNIRGGGFMGQADAARMAIARGLVEWTGSSALETAYMTYDRSMPAGDPRRKQARKFGGPGARTRKQKSYR